MTKTVLSAAAMAAALSTTCAAELPIADFT